jgi:hypothetical protein
MTQEQYETAHQELGNPLEQGALVHIAGPMERTGASWKSGPPKKLLTASLAPRESNSPFRRDVCRALS